MLPLRNHQRHHPIDRREFLAPTQHRHGIRTQPIQCQLHRLPAGPRVKRQIGRKRVHSFVVHRARRQWGRFGIEARLVERIRPNPLLHHHRLAGLLDDGLGLFERSSDG